MFSLFWMQQKLRATCIALHHNRHEKTLATLKDHRIILTFWESTYAFVYKSDYKSENNAPLVEHSGLFKQFKDRWPHLLRCMDVKDGTKSKDSILSRKISTLWWKAMSQAENMAIFLWGNEGLTLHDLKNTKFFFIFLDMESLSGITYHFVVAETEDFSLTRKIVSLIYFVWDDSFYTSL